MFAAARNDHLRRLVAQAIVPLEFIRYGLAQLGNPAARCIFRKPLRQRFGRRIFDVLRRIEIRLTCAESDHVLPFGLHLLGVGIDC